MVELEGDELVFRFPEVHENAVCRVSFQRTLRIPDDGQSYPLPPGLEHFPMEHVEDYASRLPKEWADQGGVLLPMYQAEALWVQFSSKEDFRTGQEYPFAVKIAAGKINAVTGSEWQDVLIKQPQDYLSVPDQPWIDGFCVQKGLVRQFVAMPLGEGYTAEEQISGAAEHGGLQIIVYPMKRERYLKILEKKKHTNHDVLCLMDVSHSRSSMGLAPGGLMRQTIHKDKYGYNAWDTKTSSRCFVHILNSIQWGTATGKVPPGYPPTAASYRKAGLPWFEYYDDSLKSLSGVGKLSGLDSVASKWAKNGLGSLQGNESFIPKTIIKLGSWLRQVAEGKW